MVGAAAFPVEGGERRRGEAREHAGRLHYSAWSHDLHTLLEQRGYKQEPGYDVYMARPLDRPIPDSDLALGFNIRWLAGEQRHYTHEYVPGQQYSTLWGS